VVADLSFISLATVLPSLYAVADPQADWCCLVKPQFEAGPHHVARGGVVRDSAGWAAALDRVAAAAGALGLGVRAATVSPLPGPAGNIEFFLWLVPGPAGSEGSGRASASGRAGTEERGWPATRERLLDEGRALRATVSAVATGPFDP
ncbi:MAG TPA: SAM-dependent methyltransferase, partial [Euzebyales bacterium]|nr:SAM-dependent methyltransferase [Euzebyales bacterium]